MRNRFFKHLFQMIRFLEIDLVMLVLSFLFFLSDELDAALIAIFLLGVLLFFNICGLYWMAQTVVIDERGITRYFFKKQLTDENSYDTIYLTCEKRGFVVVRIFRFWPRRRGLLKPCREAIGIPGLPGTIPIIRRCR